MSFFSGPDLPKMNFFSSWKYHLAHFGGVLACRASFFYQSPPVPVFAPTSPNNLEYLLAVSKNLAHPLHPVYDDGKVGPWKWWE